jgi:hypothetical protein
MALQEQPFILQLTWGIQDVKSWVVSYLKDGFKTLVRHIDMHFLRLFIDLSCLHVMQYKAFPTNFI